MKPRIYSFCDAGCKWEAVHKADFDRSASIVRETPDENGTYKLNPFKVYKVITGSTDGKYNAEFALQKGLVDYWFTYDEFDEYRDYIIFEILSLSLNDDSTVLTVVYEVNGNRYSDTYTDGSVFRLDEVELHILNATEVYVYNTNAEILADSQQIYETAVDSEGDECPDTLPNDELYTVPAAMFAGQRTPKAGDLVLFRCLVANANGQDTILCKITSVDNHGVYMKAVCFVQGAGNGGGGGITLVTGEVTIEASDWVANDAFGGYRAIITLPTQMNYADTVLLSRTTTNDPHITMATKWGTDTPTVRISALKPERVTFKWTVIPTSATGATQGAVIVSGNSQDEILKVDWATLKDMRDNGKLAQGKQYRITDYVCTTSQQDTQSAGHPFDIIVVADSPNTLNENARTVAHEGDTYFANCKLSAWEIKYCLDNDTARFEWAQAGGYWIDTDFTGRVFILDEKITVDGQEFFTTTSPEVLSIVAKPKTNQEVYYYADGVAVTFEEDGDNVEGWGEDEAGKGVIYYMKDEYENECPYDFKNIQFGQAYTFDTEGADDSLSGISHQNVIERLVYDTRQYLNTIIFGRGCANNTFGAGCSGITLGNNCYNNTFGAGCGSITLGSQCNENTIGSDSSTNTFGANCNRNFLRAGCNSIILGGQCTNNTFGAACSGITFGNGCDNNIVDSGVRNVEVTPNAADNVHIHSGVWGGSATNKKTIAVTPNANYVQDVRTANDVTIEV